MNCEHVLIYMFDTWCHVTLIPNPLTQKEIASTQVMNCKFALQALKDHLIRLDCLTTSFAATMICCPLNEGHTVRVTFNLIRPSKLDIDKVKDRSHILANYSLLAFVFYWRASRMHRLSTRSAVIKPLSLPHLFLTNFTKVFANMILNWFIS